MTDQHIADPTPAPRVGDVVVLHGTNVIGNVKHVGSHNGHGCLSVQVTAVLGKKLSSKAARAWKGAWVTCPPEMVDPLAAPAD